jgi:hypothetical protein
LQSQARLLGATIKIASFADTNLLSAKSILSVCSEANCPGSCRGSPTPAYARDREVHGQTVELLRQVHDHAVEGDIAWLKTKGKVYQLVDAA